MNTWYTRLMCNTPIAANGAVAAQLAKAVDTGLFSNLVDPLSLDDEISQDVSTWFQTKLSPWFLSLSARLGSETEKEELISEAYRLRVNEVVKALNVARSYYATKADQAFMSSIKITAFYKSLFCEELAKAVLNSYAKSIKQYGLFIKTAGTETEASSYQEATPEKFNWTGTVLSYHSKIINVETEQTTPECQGSAKGNGQYLPWVFTAAFGLIAWAAAAKKNN